MHQTVIPATIDRYLTTHVDLGQKLMPEHVYNLGTWLHKALEELPKLLVLLGCIGCLYSTFFKVSLSLEESGLRRSESPVAGRHIGELRHDGVSG